MASAMWMSGMVIAPYLHGGNMMRVGLPKVGGAPVNPFMGSIGIIARIAKVPVQTVFIDTDSLYLSKGWPLFRRPALPITYRVRLGQRFHPPENTREFVAQLEQYFADEMSAGSMMQTWLPAPGGSMPASASPRHAAPQRDAVPDGSLQ
jgi:hypothetical protein